MILENEEYKKYFKKIKIKKLKLSIIKVTIFLLIIVIWQLIASLEIVDTFFISSPKRIADCLIRLYEEGNLIKHILITIVEVIISLPISMMIGFIISCILWRFKKLHEILEPYLAVLNSIPKICLAPLIIFWFGNNVYAIIFMSIIMATTVTILNLISSFNNVEEEKIELLQTFGASKIQILKYLIIPNSISNLFSILKTNIGLCWIGVILGEFQVGKNGLGFLISYGSMVCKIDIVVSSILIIVLISFILYKIIEFTQKRLKLNVHKAKNEC